MSDMVLVEAPAKVNLYLGVGTRRPDGYHSVETVLQAVTLTDTVRLHSADALTLMCRQNIGIDARSNLAWRAAEGLAMRLGREPNVAIDLDKRIPVGAGFGGGSSDAAAVLAGLAALWRLDTADPKVMRTLGEVAASLGADVPFFLTGGTALFSGRGDDLVRPIAAPPLDFVLLKPLASVSTAAAYAEFDAAPALPTPLTMLMDACERGDERDVALALANNLEAVACRLVPEVADALAWVRSAEGVLGATVSGSGSAVFGICSGSEAASDAAVRAAGVGWWSAVAQSSSAGVTVYLDEEAS